MEAIGGRSAGRVPGPGRLRGRRAGGRWGPGRLLGAALVLLVLPGVGAHGAAAQVLAGTTVEQGSEAPLASVVLVVERGADTLRAESDEAGRFQLRLPSGGTWRVRAGRLGYEPIEPVEVEVPEDGGQVLTVRLRPEVIALEALEIEGRARSGLALRHQDTFTGFLHRWDRRNERSGYAIRRGDPGMDAVISVRDILLQFPPPGGR
ncbi:MAG: hypothetical protein EA352_00295 [Gemmatimonadales bacterium]|nr:MAG: hypothetical protein EA352_00295 [Gemmatimonadales bacterium]